MTRTVIDHVTARALLRVSSADPKDGQRPRDTSPEQQEQDHKSECERQNWLYGEPYDDGVVSASRYGTKKRLGYDALMDDLRHRKFGADVLMLWTTSRGSRREEESIALVNALEAAKVTVYVTSEHRLYDPANARDRQTLIKGAADDAFYSAQLSQVVSRGVKNAAQHGMYNGTVPYGYARVFDARTGRFVEQTIIESEAANVRELFDRIRRGHSLRAITIDWKKRGIVTRKGAPFPNSTLRTMLRQACYIGQRSHKNELTNGVWPAIIDETLYWEVHQIINDPSRRTHSAERPGRAAHLLSQIVRCDVCQTPLSWRSDRGRPVYRCPAGHATIGAEVLDAYVADRVMTILATPEVYAQLTASRDSDRQDVIDAQRDLARARADYDDLVASLVAGELSAKLAGLAEVGIQARITAAKSAVWALRTPARLVDLVEPGVDVRKHWSDSPLSAQREVIKLLGPISIVRRSRRGMQIGERVRWDLAV